MLFYPGDWLKDPAVRSVSLAARGLWTDMLCLMHESPRRGYLQHSNGKPVTAEQLARMTGCSTDEVSRLLRELEDAGVFSCTDHGVIYSRRMVRDEKIREIRSRSGRLGAEARLLKQNASKPSANGQANGQQTGKQNAGSSFSFSFSSSDGESISSVESIPSEESTGVGEVKVRSSPSMGSSLSEKSSGVGEIEVGAEINFCGETRQASSPPSPAIPQPPEIAGLVFPCQGSIPTWQIPSEMYWTLRQCYPGIDIEAELRKAYAWIIANPQKRKTAKGMARFLTSWMNKCVDHAHVRSPPGRCGANPVEEKNLAATAVWLESVRQRKGGDNGKL